MFHFKWLAARIGVAIILIPAGETFAQQALLEDRPVFFPKPLSSRIANYDIEVRLDPEKNLLHGNETLRWVNRSKDTINELQLHLYLNAFRNSRSTFMKESGGVSRGNRIDDDGWGFIEINSITLADGEELIKSSKFIQPDDGNEHDKTVLSLNLAKPLPPGQTISLNINFTAKLPSPPFARTGAKEDFFFAGQWFPKIGVYQDGQWNTHQFHSKSEFFADYGVYNVWINTPGDYIVGATGLEVDKKTNEDGTTTHYYRAEDVHDFAWTASPEFVEFTDKAQDVDIRVLLQPDHAYQGERHLQAAKAAVEYFQNWYGDYPFPNLTVVDPRRGAMGAGGMEYPTLITAITAYGLPEGLRLVELVIIHEFGHNYWYHLVGSNEFEEPWLDEGFTTYSEIQIMEDKYGPSGSAIDVFGIKINYIQLQRGRYILAADIDPIVKAAWEFYSGTSYRVNSYAKPGLVLTTLHNYLGLEKMQELMRTYLDRWKFKHPKTQDFIDLANEVSGQDLDWYFDQALFTNAILDYSVDDAFTRKIGKKNKGFDFDLSAQKYISQSSEADSLTETESENSEPAETLTYLDSAVTVSGDTAAVEPDMYLSGVNIRRLGTFIFPVKLEVVFDNGDTLWEEWDGVDLWKKFRYTKPAKLISAAIDPDKKIPIDVNYTNNSRFIKTHNIGVNKLAIRFLFWIQFLMDQPEALNMITGFNPVF